MGTNTYPRASKQTYEDGWAVGVTYWREHDGKILRTTSYYVAASEDDADALVGMIETLGEFNDIGRLAKSGRV